MSIETAQKLKTQFTDKFVTVKPGVPELRRFASLTGVVKTVNMSGRALVQFDGPADIGWYDIDPEYLVIVEAPAKKGAAEKHAAPTKAVEEKKPAAAPKAPGNSPLDMARAQGAGGVAAPAKPAAAAPGAAPAKKLSPLELARQQGALKADGHAAPASTTPAAAPAKAAAPTAAPAPAKKMSPLEIARTQGAAKGECLSGPGSEATATSPGGSSKTEPAAAVPPPPSSTPVSPTPAAAAVAEVPKPAAPSGQKLSPLELARQQGAFKPKN